MIPAFLLAINPPNSNALEVPIQPPPIVRSVETAPQLLPRQDGEKLAYFRRETILPDEPIVIARNAFTNLNKSLNILDATNIREKDNQAYAYYKEIKEIGQEINLVLPFMNYDDLKKLEKITESLNREAGNYSKNLETPSFGHTLPKAIQLFRSHLDSSKQNIIKRIKETLNLDDIPPDATIVLPNGLEIKLSPSPEDQDAN